MGKKTLFTASVLAFSCLGMIAFSAQGQDTGWQRISGPIDGRITCLAAPHGKSGTVFAGSEDGLYAIDTMSMQSRKMEGAAAIKNIRDVVFDSGAIYVAASNGIYIGKDGGNFELLHVKEGINGMRVLAGPEEDPGRLVAWTGKEIFLVSEEGWKLIASSPLWGEIDDAGYKEGKIYVASGGDVYFSNGLGGKWDKVSLYADDVREESSVTTAEDAGETPEKSEEDAAPVKSRIYQEAPGGPTVATADGIYRINAAESDAERVDTDTMAAKGISCVVDGRQGLFAGTKDTVFRYVAEEGAWEPFFEKAGDGEITCIYDGFDAAGKAYLFVSAGKSVYVRDISSGFIEEGRKKFDLQPDMLREPSILEVQKMAVEYAEVSPEKIKRWRGAARWKAVMPKLSVGFGEDRGRDVEIYTSATTSYHYIGPEEVSGGWDADLSWDFSDLIWNEAQTSIDVRSKLMVQLRNEILQEVTRLYFERKRLMTETEGEHQSTGAPERRSLKKGKGQRAWSAQEKLIRIEELTAHIDALTGGEFSRGLNADDHEPKRHDLYR